MTTAGVPRGCEPTLRSPSWRCSASRWCPPRSSRTSAIRSSAVGDVNLWGLPGPLRRSQLSVCSRCLTSNWSTTRRSTRSGPTSSSNPGRRARPLPGRPPAPFRSRPWLQLYLLLSLAVTMVGCTCCCSRTKGGRARRASPSPSPSAASVRCGDSRARQGWRSCTGRRSAWRRLPAGARLWDRRVWPGRLLLARVAFLLCSRLDVGYIAGSRSPRSCSPWAGPSRPTGPGRRGWTLGRSRLRGWSSGLREDLRAHRGTAIALAAAGRGRWRSTSRSSPDRPVGAQLRLLALAGHLWWASPARLLLPILPGVDRPGSGAVGDSRRDPGRPAGTGARIGGRGRPVGEPAPARCGRAVLALFCGCSPSTRPRSAGPPGALVLVLCASAAASPSSTRRCSACSRWAAAPGAGRAGAR